MNDVTAKEPAGPGRRTRRFVVLRLLVAIAIASAALFLVEARWPDAMGIRNALLAVSTTFPLMLAAVLITGWRLSVLVGGGVRAIDGMAVNAVAQFVVLIVPSRLSEVAKPIGLNLLCGVPLAAGAVALALERVLDAAFLAVMALAAVAILGGTYRDSFQSSGLVLAVIAGVGVLGVALLLARPRLLHHLTAHIPMPWLHRQADHVADALSGIANMRAASLAVGLSVAAWIASYLIFLVFFHVLGIGQLSPGQVLVVFVASTLGLIISVAPGGLGTFEGAIALSLAAFGVPMGTAVAMALLLRLCLVIPVVAAASWFIISGDLSLSRILTRLRDWRGRNEQDE